MREFCSEKCRSCNIALHPSTNFQDIRNVIRDAVHVSHPRKLVQVFRPIRTFCKQNKRKYKLASGTYVGPSKSPGNVIECMGTYQGRLSYVPGPHSSH